MSENEKTQKEKDDENTVSSFEQMFDSYGAGWTLSIYRESPKELSGFLEEMELEPGENPINMQYLISQWGGKVLRLMLRDDKGQYKKRLLIPLKSFPPRVNGRLCNAPDDTPTKDPKREFLEYLELVKAMKPEPLPIQTSQIDTLLPMFTPILKAIAERALTPPQFPQIQSQAASMTDTLAALSAMRDFVSPAQESDLSGTMISIAEKLLPLITDRNSKPQVQPVVLPAIRPIHPPMPMPMSSNSPPPMPSNSPPPMPSNSPPPMPISSGPVPTDEQMMEYLGDKLANGTIGGKELSKLYFDTLARLPDNEQEEAEKYLENALGIEPIDEPEKPQDIPTPIPRRTAGADKGDDSAHRSSDKKGG